MARGATQLRGVCVFVNVKNCMLLRIRGVGKTALCIADRWPKTFRKTNSEEKGIAVQCRDDDPPLEG